MLRLNLNGCQDWFTITDDSGCRVSAKKEELNNLYQQLVKAKDDLITIPQQKEKAHIVLLENNCSCEKVQLRLSDSALRFLDFLFEYGWINDDDTTYTEIEDVDYEFI